MLYYLKSVKYHVKDCLAINGAKSVLLPEEGEYGSKF